MKTVQFASRALVSACTLVLSGQVMAAAYKLPETSLNGTALSAAYVANAHGPDSSYYNPAAMVFSEDQGRAMEADLTLAHLSRISASLAAFGPGVTDKSRIENIFIPSFHYISPSMGDWRYGFSMVVPGGLSKRWSGLGSSFAKEFTLEIVELNPTIGYKLTDRLAVGGGLRVVHSKGKVTSANDGLVPVGRDMRGSSWDFGYNLALHFKATENLKLSATYRSKVDLTEEGTATLTHSSGAVLYPIPGFGNDASVTVPLPAALSLAAAFSFDRTTVELVYERTYWSAYKNLDFDYSIPLSPGPLAAFDDPLTKNWKDTNTFRIGVTHQLNDRWTLMGGFAIDKTPVNPMYAGFELPDTDAKIFSIGAKYKYSDDLTLGAALLYDKKDKLTLAPGQNAESGGVFGPGATFENAEAYLLTVGMEYKF